MMRTRTTRLVAVAAAAALLTSGCGVFSGGLRGVPLPGGADLGSAPYELKAEFSDVVDLVPQSMVKVNDVPVGTVTGIGVGPNWTAEVTMLVNADVRLPADAQARVRTTSLLGEKFVELIAPPEAAGGAKQSLTGGATIPLARTGRAAEVEEVFGALSMLLNGGGVAQIRTIASELNKALSGNEPEIRALLSDVDTLVGALDDKKDEITRALTEVNRLSSTLNEHKAQVETALDDLAPGLRELESQRGQLVDMLQALDRLSGVATDVVENSRDDLLADLRLLQPTLNKLAESGSSLPRSLEILPSPPFTDASIEAFAGDYSNLYATLDLDLGDLLGNLARSNQPFPGPDGPLGALPPTAQLLGPLVGPLVGDSGGLKPPPSLLGPGGLLGPPAAAPNAAAPNATAPASGTPAPSPSSTPTPTPTPTKQPGLLDSLFGGGR